MTEPTRTIAAPGGPADPPPPADKPVPQFLADLQREIGSGVTALSYWVGDWTAILSIDRLVAAAQYLRDAPGARFEFLSDLTASDWPPRSKRFDVIYSLYSISLKHRVRLKVQAGDGEPVPTVTVVWPSANWLEREVFDLFGIRFAGHPDLRRILMPDDWQGHPQRKDYPLEGPGEMLMENPLDWLNLKHREEIE
jgi:NADH-quinone oxidoreductase subunit C